MNTQRAAEIAGSPVMAHVTYGEHSVYIQHVDETSGMARIYALDQPERELEVPVGQLEERSGQEIAFDGAVPACSTERPRS